MEQVIIDNIPNIISIWTRGADHVQKWSKPRPREFTCARSNKAANIPPSACLSDVFPLLADRKSPDAKECRRAIRKTLRKGTPQQVVTACFLPGDTDLTADSADISKIADDTFMIVVHTKRQLAVDTAQERGEYKKEYNFLSNISHEIRTPLNAIIGITSLLVDTNLTYEQLDFVDTIKQSGINLMSIINDILDISKLEANKLSLSPEPTRLSDIAAKSFDIIAPDAKKKKIEVSYSIDDDVPDVVKIDGPRLTQIIVNLLSNGVKFTPAADGSPSESAARVSMHIAANKISRKKMELSFSIRDTGIGIADADHDKIFRPFTQIDQSITKEYEGTGLGLIISKQLAELMGGDMWFESEVGRGSTFHFTVIAGACTSKPSSVDYDYDAAIKGRRVFVVDDNEINRKHLQHLLAKWNMKVFLFTSADEIMTHLQYVDHEFDLGLIDICMPKCSGDELAESIRRMGFKMPLFAISSWGDKLGNGTAFKGHFAKPINEERLRRALYNLFINVDKSTHADKSTHTDKSTHADPSSQANLNGSDSCGSLSPNDTITPSDSENSMKASNSFPNALNAHAVEILIAEDIYLNQKVIRSMLAKLGYMNVDVAGNGKEALRAMKKKKYDLLFLDIKMPVMDGITCAKKIYKKYKNTAPYIIALTALGMVGDRERTLRETKIDRYLVKPIDITQLRGEMVLFEDTLSAN